MEPIDRNLPATNGDLHDVRDELRTEIRGVRDELRDEFRELFRAQTMTLAGEIARAVEVVIEDNRSQFRAASDETRAVADRLDARVADASVHRLPGRPR